MATTWAVSLTDSPAHVPNTPSARPMACPTTGRSRTADEPEQGDRRDGVGRLAALGPDDRGEGEDGRVAADGHARRDEPAEPGRAGPAVGPATRPTMSPRTTMTAAPSERRRRRLRGPPRGSAARRAGRRPTRRSWRAASRAPSSDERPDARDRTRRRGPGRGPAPSRRRARWPRPASARRWPGPTHRTQAGQPGGERPARVPAPVAAGALAATAGPAAGCRGRTCGRCRRSAPAWTGRP